MQGAVVDSTITMYIHIQGKERVRMNERRWMEQWLTVFNSAMLLKACKMESIL